MKLQPSRHHVAIAGQVSDAETGQVIAGAQVRLTQGPATFQRRLALQALQYGDRWETLARRPDRTYTAVDGFFHFLDLPPSNSPSDAYRLTVTVPPVRSRYRTEERTVSVIAPGDRLKPDRLKLLEIALSPTAAIPSPKP